MKAPFLKANLKAVSKRLIKAVKRLLYVVKMMIMMTTMLKIMICKRPAIDDGLG